MSRHLVYCVLALALVSGCRKGPDTKTLKRQVQARLDRAFKAGLFEVRELSRRGHYPYSEEGDSQQRLLVYYNAEIAFLRDYRLSNWDQLNVGSLISVLGATPNGVQGVNPEGNRKGDLLRVHGASAYAEEQDDKWRPVAFLPAAQKQKQRSPADKDLLPYRKHLKELGQLGAAFQASKERSDLKAFTAQLETVLAESERRLGRSKGWWTIASGSRAGEYFRQGRALAQILTRAGQQARSYRTSGSTQNCRLVEGEEVIFGYSQNDIAHMAHKGTELFEGQIPMTGLRALCSLYPEAVQVVARADAKIRDLQDLRGKRVNIGGEGSGVRVNALQVLRAVGLTLRDFKEVHREGIPEALELLHRGRLDAFFLTSAYPNQALYKLADKTPIEVVPLDGATVDKLTARYPFFSALTLPPNTYPGMKQGRRTVQVTAMLVTHANTAATRVRTLLTELYGNVGALTRGSLQAYFITRDRALQGVSIPLHPAAKTFFGK